MDPRALCFFDVGGEECYIVRGFLKQNKTLQKPMARCNQQENLKDLSTKPPDALLLGRRGQPSFAGASGLVALTIDDAPCRGEKSLLPEVKVTAKRAAGEPLEVLRLKGFDNGFGGYCRATWWNMVKLVGNTVGHGEIGRFG